MRIQRFQFRDERTGWQLEESEFGQFNLLVGVSGVGKTKVLQAIRRVASLVTDSDTPPGPMSWRIEFEAEAGGEPYLWQGMTNLAGPKALPEPARTQEGPIEFANERIAQGQRVIVDRAGDRFEFAGSSLPKLNRANSAIFLLSGEQEIIPLNLGFRLILLSMATDIRPTVLDSGALDALLATHRSYRSSVDALRKAIANAGVSSASKFAQYTAYLLQEAYPAVFAALKEEYLEIFPTVEDMKVTRSNVNSGLAVDQLEFTIREQGSDQWIAQSELSSGMLRTLVHLIEITVAPSGSVILIDELENSLGVNCMPALTRLLLKRADVQFIVTSHHPYILNKIPLDTWKLVKRHGGHVSLVSARDVPGLKSASHHEAFTRLMISPDYQHGSAASRRGSWATLAWCGSIRRRRSSSHARASTMCDGSIPRRWLRPPGDSRRISILNT